MSSRSQPAVEMQIAPLIDVCFLLLFFYLLTAAESTRESVVATPLPGSVEQSERLDFGDVQQLLITASGDVFLNGAALDSAESRTLPKLRGVLSRFQQTASDNKSEARVTIQPENTVPYQRLIDVLAACEAEGIKVPLLAAPLAVHPDE
jgi:biopolymer transport protein ExbD